MGFFASISGFKKVIKMLWHGVDVPHDDSKSSFLEMLGVRFKSRPRASIAIVGGGLAGLVAGFEAMSLGFGVQIYEGRAHRNGGRIQTKSDLVPDMWAEAGPEFISPAHEILLWYVRRFGLGLLQTEGMEISPFTPVLLDERVDVGEIARASAKFKEVLIKEADGLSVEDYKQLESIDSDTLWELVEDQSFSEPAQKYLETHLEFENGLNPRKIGVLPYLMLVKSHQSGFFENLEKFRLDGGMSRLIEALERELPNPVQRKHHIRSVIRENKFTLRLDRKPNTEDDVIKNHDAIIITVPPRLWDGGELFNVNLTSDLIPQMGDSIKILIRVPGNADFSTGILPSAFLERDSLVQAIWESGIGRLGDSKILTVMCGGRAAEQLGRMSQEEAIYRIVDEITDYHPHVNISTKRENFYFKDWGRKRHTGCGYGCPAPYEFTDFRPEMESMLPENLHLCGEWNSWEMWGYMEGAIRSALCAVLKICRSFEAEIPKFLLERLTN